MEQERSETESLAPLGVMVAAIVVAGLVFGAAGAIIGGTLLVVALTAWTAIGSHQPRTSTSHQNANSDDAHAVQATLIAAALPAAASNASFPIAPPAAVPAPVEAAPERAAASPSFDWRALSISSTVLTRSAVAIVTLFFAWFFLTDLGNNPAGFFCDEAEIGIRAHQLFGQVIHGHWIFFYPHFSYTSMGSLPLYATAPFVLLLGLSDFSVRLASMVFAAAAIVFLVLFVRRLKWCYGEAGVIAFAASPVYIHFARINFGQAPSMLCVAAALYCYAVAKERATWRWPIAAGVLFALSAFGNPGYYLATPMTLLALGIGEIVVNRLHWRRYRTLAITAGAVILSWSPVLVRWQTDSNFMRRFHDKTGTTGAIFSVDRLHTIAENYGRYFSLDYLFLKGEAGLPGGYIARHSVIGSGELQLLLLPLVLFGIIGTFAIKEERTRLFGAMGIALMLFYPIPDAMSTPVGNPPYTVTAMLTMTFIPILAALGVYWLVRWLQGREISAILRPRIVGAVLIALALLSGARFFTGPYADYPNVSAGYYGWQYGPRQAIEIFKQYRNDYDRYQLDGDFNEAYIFLDFYLDGDQELRNKTMIGGLVLVDLRKHELIAVRAEKYNALMESNDPMRRYVTVKDVIHYPNGEIAMYVLDVGMQNDQHRLTMPY